MNNRIVLLLLSLTLGVSGCTMMPRYIRPPAPVTESWPVAESDAAQSEWQAWGSFFTDPAVHELLSLAVANNRDLRVALLNIEKMRAQYHIQRADLLPTITAGGDATIQQLPGDMSATRVAGISRTYSATVGFSAYELDLFGRVRSLKESALQEFLATEEAARSAEVSLVAELVGAYMKLAADTELYGIAKAAFENRVRVHQLVVVQYNNGLASQLVVNQARSSMEEARVAVAQYEAQVGEDRNILTLLLGSSVPESIQLAEKLADVRSLPDLAPGMPSELIQRRPDILAAEHQLQAANANIGAARANFFPKISITSAIGTITPQFDDLFTGGAGTWLFAPQAVLPIFDTGRNIAILQSSHVQREIAVATYEKSIQTAFREVADALAQRQSMVERLAGQAALVDAARKSYDLSLARYKAGIDSFMNVLDSQRTLFAAEQGLVGVRLLREVTILNLYKALGGGWEAYSTPAS